MAQPAYLLAVAALTLTGCANVVSVPVNLLSRADFPPAERDAVWSRALTGMHATGLVTAAAEGDARFVVTEYPTARTQCGRRKCDVVGTLQIVITPLGTLSARYNRTFSGEVTMTPGGGWKPLLHEDHVGQLQRELDDWVAGVIAGTGAAP